MADSPPPLADLAPAALFLDFDGTLVELADAPDRIEVPSRLRPLLETLADRLEGRLAVVSGRSVADLEQYLGSGGWVLAGSHGAEFRYADGKTLPVLEPAGLGEAREEARAFAEGTHGLLVEEKPTGLAIHYRLAPDREREVRDFAEGLAARHGFALQLGKMVAELKPPGADKGAAVRKLMLEPPFEGARPVVVGDDLTDEDAFRAAAELGGTGILVGAPRETAAGWRLEDVGAALSWLEASLNG
ncbi:MAG TPA: trehalose-phosphatase [Allosphingosinicella sp.]|jgi:trehalose 6-phosphate phosphatase